MRAYGGGRVSTAGSSTAPAGGLYAIASRPLYLREVGIFNTTTTATAVALYRATTLGTTSSNFTARSEDSEITPVGVLVNDWSADPTITAGPFMQATLGAAAGAGVIWTFGAEGLRIPAGTANGIVLAVPTGTGQIWDCYFVWDE